MPANQEDKDTVTYELRRSGKVVYIGTTNNTDRREAEHRLDRKRFDELKRTSKPMTEKRAKQKEAEDLKAYRCAHRGKNPIYNDDDDG